MGARAIVEKSDNLQPVERPATSGKVTRAELAQRAEGPFQTVRREPLINMGPIVAKVNAAASDVPNFCRYQPNIARFARANPDNLAATIIFVLASQGTAWHNLVGQFPEIMDHIRKNNGLYPFPENVTWKATVYYGGRAIESVWMHRKAIFRQIEHAKSDLDVFAVLVTVPGLSLPKAGFAAQLICGKYGCIDSVNSSIFGVPLDLMTVSKNNQPSFISMKGFVKDGKLTPTGHQKLELYIQFLDSIKLASQDSVSEQLWDSWCDIVAAKIWHASTPRGSLDVRYGRHRIIHPTYPGNVKPREGEFDLQDPVTPGSDAERLKQQHDRLAKLPPEKRGQFIGKQHKELITGESLSEAVADIVSVGGEQFRYDEVPSEPFCFFRPEDRAYLDAVNAGMTDYFRRQRKEPNYDHVKPESLLAWTTAEDTHEELLDALWDWSDRGGWQNDAPDSRLNGRVWPSLGVVSFWAKEGNVSTNDLNALVGAMNLKHWKYALQFMDTPDDAERISIPDWVRGERYSASDKAYHQAEVGYQQHLLGAKRSGQSAAGAGSEVAARRAGGWPVAKVNALKQTSESMNARQIIEAKIGDTCTHMLKDRCCARRASVKRGGKGYCSSHDPEREHLSGTAGKDRRKKPAWMG